MESSHAEMLPRDNGEQLPLVMRFRDKSTLWKDEGREGEGSF